MKNLTLLQAKCLADDADRLFERAGNNSGDPAKLTRGEKRCDMLRRQAEQLLKPLGIVVDYPGLYPSFTVHGFGHHSTLSAVSAALESSSPTATAQGRGIGGAQ